VSEAIYAMCEGELIHVCQRRNLELSKDNYIVIAKKKTASLFAACCHAGTIIGNHGRPVQTALREFGLNFGVAFQLVDDCRDVTSEEGELGKHPGQDVLAGDITLPLLALSDSVGMDQREEIKNMFGSADDKNSLRKLRTMLVDSDALSRTQNVITSYLENARESLDTLTDSVYKESLEQLVDHTTEKSF
jgi:octaprenyl-diphosphate synthase